jgi:hypothetical protein
MLLAQNINKIMVTRKSSGQMANQVLEKCSFIKKEIKWDYDDDVCLTNLRASS